ncbi:germin-like protein subfamily 1 member 1 [Silene latifolia]|uniref:germin-like protein subfamily 1 member 1 n=1 Tax=Silene latifolia TaxID=37657 RepID=UPI003D772E6E
MKTKIKKQIFLVLVLFLLLGLVSADPNSIIDYCIADTSSPHYISNGPTCLSPNSACSSHFTTSALSKPGNTTANKFGFSVILTTNLNLPGHRTQGLSMARIDIAPNGLVPPHSHPRASEVTTCLKGEILLGFIDTSNKMYTQKLRPGESYVFPKGLIHFLYNVDKNSPAVAISGLSSENPGTQIASISNFASTPTMPTFVLEKAFKIDAQEVNRISNHLKG